MTVALVVLATLQVPAASAGGTVRFPSSHVALGEMLNPAEGPASVGAVAHDRLAMCAYDDALTRPTERAGGLSTTIREVSATRAPGGRVTDSVPDPAPVRKPSGAAARGRDSSPWYVSYRDADGNLQTVGNQGGVHAEMRIQQMEPGAQMSRPFGWRTVDDSSGPQWVPGTVCRDCQRLSRELFHDTIEGAPGGPWDDLP